MRAALVLVALLPTVTLAQVGNYVGANPKAAICAASTFVIAPTLTVENVGASLDPEDLGNAASTLASAVVYGIKGSEIIQPSNLATIDYCASTVVVLRLKSYHTESARMGQHRGFIAVQVLFFDSPKSQTPTNTKDFDASGAVHWGDSTPFANAVKSVASKIRHGLG